MAGFALRERHRTKRTRPHKFSGMVQYVAELEDEYDQIIPYAQALLDTHPGKRIEIPHNPRAIAVA